MSMYKTMYHPQHGARKFWEGDAKALEKCGWYDDPDKFPLIVADPVVVADPIVEPVVEPPKRGRKPRKAK